MPIRMTAMLLLCAGLAGPTAAQGAPPRKPSPLSEAEFDRLHRQLQPDPSEGWRTIPWRVSLLDGQRVAAKGKKPIFIWAMDGHPLGCT